MLTPFNVMLGIGPPELIWPRSEEHTSELQSLTHLLCFCISLPSPTRRSSDLSFLEVIKIIFDGALIRAGNLFLAQRALGFALRPRDCLGISDLALALDADSLQRDARHRAAGTDLAQIGRAHV